MSQTNSPIIVGNWKMYKTIEESLAFLDQLIPLVKESTDRIYLAVPFTVIKSVSEKAKETNIVIGAQNMNEASEGAFTGEIAAKMIKDAGAQFVVLGHSERRSIYHETNEIVNKKVLKALSEGLQLIVCVGETIEEHDGNKTHEILTEQLIQSLQNVTSEQFKSIMIAYEPIWAIGSDQPATPEKAQEVHLFCRQLLSEHWPKDVTDHIPLLYGGSVKPENAKALLSQPDINGVLVGGASLNADSFSKIVNYQNS
jgi:triosephosphate isomerase